MAKRKLNARHDRFGFHLQDVQGMGDDVCSDLGIFEDEPAGDKDVKRAEQCDYGHLHIDGA